MAANRDFHLIYWPAIPGRGEHVRLALELAGATYTDTAQQDKGMETVGSLVGKDNSKLVGDVDAAASPPFFAPPALRHGGLLLSQTPNVLMYLGEQFGDKLVPEGGKWAVNALALTALDGLSNEPHDCHHPMGSGLYYEEQKTEALRRSRDYVKNRLPMFLGYFQRVLDSEASGDGPWLYRGQLSYADLVLFQCVDGLGFMFPKAMGKMKESGKYDGIWKLHEAVRETDRIKEYLESNRRQQYSMGIYRYYEELDLVE